MTPGEKLQRGFSGIADRAKPPVMIYSVRSTGEARIRIAVQGLTPGEKPKIAYDAPSTGWLVDSTRDGKWAAVIRPISTSESTLELKKTPRPAPVLLSVHGGPAGASSVGWDVFRRFYSALGYVVVEPNVRGSFGFGRAFEMGDDGRKRPDGIKDLEAVGRWVVAQPWADKDRLVIFGGSYGGYSVLMGLTRHGSLWRAGVDAFGISSWKSFFTATDGTIRELFKKEVGDPDKDADFLESISPLADAGKISVPLFVYAGANDPRVPRSESDQIVRSLRERKVPVEYMVAANEGHSFSHVENKVEFLARSARFLEKALAK